MAVTSTEELLDQAIATAKAGNRRDALGLFAQVVELDPRNDTAWRWLAELVETDAHRIQCFERVVSINPDNPYAQHRLESLRRKAATPPTTISQSEPAAHPPPLPSSPPIDTGQAATAARQESDETAETIRLTCPTCGARLEATEDIDRFACLHCGNEVLVTRRGGTPSIESLTPATPPPPPPPSPLPITVIPSDTPALRPSPRKAQRSGCSRWSIIFCAACLLFICAGIWILLASPSGNGSSRSTSLTIGDKAILYDDQGIALLVAVDYQSLEALIDALAADDDYGASELLLTGRLFSVDSGTRVLVTDLALFTTEVRILEGPYEGRKVWVVDEVLRPR